jgi:Outer membrane protein beta-barrel domain
MRCFVLSFLPAALLVAAVAQPAHAQLRFGPQISLQDTWAAQQVAQPYQATASRHRRGLQAGVLLEVPCERKLAVQPALLYTSRSLEIEKKDNGYRSYTTRTTRAHVGALELPVNLVYTAGAKGGLQLFGGPYAALGLHGEATVSAMYFSLYEGVGESKTSPVRFSSQASPDPLDARLRRLDAGVQGGIGYRRGPWQTQVSYSLGLLNRLPRTADTSRSSDQLYSRALQFSLAYLFMPSAG